MWTEILNENVGVTRIGTHKVLWAIGDVTEDEARAAKRHVEHEHVFQNQLEQLRELSKQIERDREFMELLDKYGVDLKKNVSTNKTW